MNSALIIIINFAIFSSLQEMLYRRLHKLQQLVNCNNQLEKAKPQKKEEVSRAGFIVLPPKSSLLPRRII